MKLKMQVVAGDEFQAAVQSLSVITFPSLEDNRAVAKLVREAREEATTYYKTRNGILEKYGKLQPGSVGVYDIVPETAPEFRTALEKLDGEEVEIGPTVALTLPKNALLCGRDLNALDAFLATPTQPAA